MEGVVLPTSKSVAARALICRAVFGTRTRIEDVPDCDDTRDLQAALDVFASSEGNRCLCRLGSGAASFRFFLAYVASMAGTEVEMECSPQLMLRPVGPLVEALRSIGADIRFLGEEGRPPLLVKGRKLEGGRVAVDASVSSQFVSAMMMASPLWEHGFEADFAGIVPVSAPYIAMTRRVMDVFRHDPAVFRIEADWSAASYFFEYALLHPGRDVVVENLDVAGTSLQGDAACMEIFATLGVGTEALPEGGAIIRGDDAVIRSRRDSGGVFVRDMSATPDLVPALAVGLCFAGIPFRFEGVAHLRHKECDRLDALCEELGKAGFGLEACGSSLSWDGTVGKLPQKTVFDAHGDHRMAMALAVAEDYVPGMEIADKNVVSKSFSGFFEQLAKLKM